jgi:hypothetical protein
VIDDVIDSCDAGMINVPVDASRINLGKTCSVSDGSVRINEWKSGDQSVVHGLNESESETEAGQLKRVSAGPVSIGVRNQSTYGLVNSSGRIDRICASSKGCKIVFRLGGGRSSKDTNNEEQEELGIGHRHGTKAGSGGSSTWITGTSSARWQYE